MMVRHLGDPRVGAVTAYIKEGSRPANYLNRFIAYEYVNAQAGARRAQNVLGAQACLAGGAQLIRRESLEAIGGVIDTSTLAEDTVTTLNIQLRGLARRVRAARDRLGRGAARHRAALWKQRLRWARGNVQVTRHFRHVWLRGRRVGRLGSVSFALIWFTILLMPRVHDRRVRARWWRCSSWTATFSRRRVPGALGDQPGHLPVRDADRASRSIRRPRAPAGARASPSPA